MNTSRGKQAHSFAAWVMTTRASSPNARLARGAGVDKLLGRRRVCFRASAALWLQLYMWLQRDELSSLTHANHDTAAPHRRDPTGTPGCRRPLVLAPRARIDQPQHPRDSAYRSLRALQASRGQRGLNRGIEFTVEAKVEDNVSGRNILQSAVHCVPCATEPQMRQHHILMPSHIAVEPCQRSVISSVITLMSWDQPIAELLANDSTKRMCLR